MDLVKRRELAFLLAFKGVTRDMVKKGDGAAASVSEWQGPHVAFLTKNRDSRPVQLAKKNKVFDEESDSGVNKCNILEPGGKN